MSKPNFLKTKSRKFFFKLYIFLKRGVNIFKKKKKIYHTPTTKIHLNKIYFSKKN